MKKNNSVTATATILLYQLNSLVEDCAFLKDLSKDTRKFLVRDVKYIAKLAKKLNTSVNG